MEIPTILIIDDDANLRKTLSDILRHKGYETRAAVNGAEALVAVKQAPCSVALIDLNLPDMSGMDVLNRIKEEHPSTQAIILTGNATLTSAIEATNKGAFSYLQKPYDIEQLLLNIRRAIEKQQADEQIVRYSDELKRKNEELSVMYEEAKACSLHDPLTGLANRRHLDVIFDRHFAKARRCDTPLSIIMLDIDHFKTYNDAYGHAAGDGLLIKLAEVLSREVRKMDLAVRYGGEEFIILLPDTNAENAARAADRMRKAIERDTGATVSLGVASYYKGIQESANLIAQADEAMYRAKGGGRNRVELWVSP